MQHALRTAAALARAKVEEVVDKDCEAETPE